MIKKQLKVIILNLLIVKFVKLLIHVRLYFLIFFIVRFKIFGKKDVFDLIEIERPDCDYIILESLNQMKDNCNIKSIHVIKLTGENITIGRGHESDVRINDISVSRSHACLKYDSNTGGLLLRDLRSKFGTLVLLKRPLTIKERKIHLQIGRTYIEASLMNMKDFEKLKKEKKQKLQQQHQEKAELQKSNYNPAEQMDIDEGNK